MRINARLDNAMSEKLHFLEETTGQNASDIIRQALDLYYQHIQGQRKNALEIFRETGFIGSGNGPGDLSENYKQYLNFGQKYDQP